MFGNKNNGRTPTPGKHAEEYLNFANTPAGIDALQLMDCLIADAIDFSASDIHIEPWQSGVVARLRVQGILRRHVTIPSSVMERLSGRAKVMAEMERFRPSQPQEGHADWEHIATAVQLRISVFPTKRGEKIVIRLFDERERTFQLDGLGFEPAITAKLKDILEVPNGTILFTGPTGSGKTTAIYASLCYLTERFGETISISTVEDPVEFSLPMVSQGEINPEREFTYPVALRSLMRQDPQVIMIGEIRDSETATIAMNAGLTGHMVLSTIHSPGTAGVFARLMHMGIPPFLLASSVRCVVGLRLVRQNCTYCSAPYQPDGRLLALLPKGIVEHAQFRSGSGCEHCGNTGFAGRKALQELMLVPEEMQEAILTRSTVQTLQSISHRAGNLDLWRTGLGRVINGELPLEELVRVVQPVALDEDNDTMPTVNLVEH